MKRKEEQVNKEFFKKIIKNKIWIILAIVVCFRLLVYSSYNEYSIYVDTSTYVNFEANILKGEVDALRTPVYPYIIKFVSLFSSNETAMYMNITILQEIVSIISVVILYMTLKKEFKNQAANYFATILYGCLPSIFTYNKVILTESLAISLFVMYICLIIKYIKKPTNSKTILIGVFTLLLIMLRPSFMYLIVALAIIFILIFICKKENRKQAILGAGVLLCIGLLVLGYCYLNKKQNNIFAISNVSQINQLDTIIQMEIYNTGDNQDKEIIDIIELRLDGYDQTWYRATTDKIMQEYTPDEIDGYIGRCIKNNFASYLVQTIRKALTLPFKLCDEIYLRQKDTEIIKPLICFAIVYLYVFFEIIHILIKIIKNKKMPLEQTIMLIIILGQLATIILGAQAEYSRLFVPTLPIVIIAIAWHIDKTLEESEDVTPERKKIENEI